MFLCTAEGETSIALSHLANARLHFDDAMSERHRRMADSGKGVSPYRPPGYVKQESGVDSASVINPSQMFLLKARGSLVRGSDGRLFGECERS